MLKAFCFLFLVLITQQAVNAIDFDGQVVSCEAARRFNRYISCLSDGSYNITQCRNDYCSCVNGTTGVPISGSVTFRVGSKPSNYCKQLIACGPWNCDLFCLRGYTTDDQGCRQCSCQQVNCNYTSITDATKGCGIGCVTYDGICISCIRGCNSNITMPTSCGSDEEFVRYGFGRGICRPRLRSNDTCVRDDDNNDDDDYDDDDDEEEDGHDNHDDDHHNGSDHEEEEEDDDDDDDDYVSDYIPIAQLELASSIEEDMMEKDEDDRISRIFTGSASRRASRKINRYINQCRSGYYCRKVRDDSRGRCNQQNTNGICYRNSNDASGECDSNGYYKPRYCRVVTANNRRRIVCVCVIPSNGTRLTDTRTSFDDTGNEDENENRKPKCSQRVYGTCRVTRDGRRFLVKHGERDTNPCMCRTCVCYFGTLYCRTRRNCNRCDSSKTCTLPNDAVLRHGQSARVDCNRCSCRFGNLYCTDRDCNTTVTTETNCTRCRSERVRKVCGPNGKTYINSCTATYCAGIASVDLIDGPCPRTNPCIRFPCDSGHVCLRRGGVSCLARNTGCRPDTLRLCINVTNLSCTNETATMTRSDDDDDDSDTDGDGIGNGDVDPDDTSICGTDGNTYPSICHMLQSTVNVTILHAGRCNALRCKGGQVCGTDGVTYENICELRTQSNNARFDYRGACVDDSDDTPDEVCERVISSGRCRYNTSNCPCLVRPAVGCCPVCGGAVIALLDREGISNASSLDPDLETLDGFIRQIVSDELFLNVTAERCSVESSLTTAGNIELAISSMSSSSDDKCFCHRVATNITIAINRSVEEQSIARKRRQTTTNTDTSLSPSYQYILGASEAELETSTGGPGTEGTGTTATPTSSGVTATFAFMTVLLLTVLGIVI